MGIDNCFFNTFLTISSLLRGRSKVALERINLDINSGFPFFRARLEPSLGKGLGCGSNDTFESNPVRSLHDFGNP